MDAPAEIPAPRKRKFWRAIPWILLGLASACGLIVMKASAAPPWPPLRELVTKMTSARSFRGTETEVAEDHQIKFDVRFLEPGFWYQKSADTTMMDDGRWSYNVTYGQVSVTPTTPATVDGVLEMFHDSALDNKVLAVRETEVNGTPVWMYTVDMLSPAEENDFWSRVKGTVGLNSASNLYGGMDVRDYCFRKSDGMPLQYVEHSGPYVRRTVSYDLQTNVDLTPADYTVKKCFPPEIAKQLEAVVPGNGSSR